MKTSEFTQMIWDMVSKDQLEVAIRELTAVLQKSEKLADVVIQSARHADLVNQIRRGTLSPEQILAEKNKIRYAILDLSRDIEGYMEQHPEQEPGLFDSSTPAKTQNTSQFHFGQGHNISGDLNIYNNNK